MTGIVDETTVLAWARLLKAQRSALSQVESALRQAKLPPLIWYDVLLELERCGEKGLRPFELEKEMLLVQYNLSRLTDRLEAAGFIARQKCDDDGRGQVLMITKRGREIRQKMWPVYARAIEQVVGTRLTGNEAQTLARLLGKLLP